MTEDNPELPKTKESKITERKGLRILQEIIEEELSWFFRENHLEDDYGIDGFFDIISERGQVTGKTISFQLKTGRSYLNEENEIGFVFRSDNKHLNYYSNYDLPVLIILVDPVKRIAYWEKFDVSKTENAGNSWKMTIPKNKFLNIKSKESLLKFISPVTDYVAQMEKEWQINKMLKAGNNRILFRIPKDEVFNKKYDFILEALQRIQATPELIIHLKNKVEISFDDFDNDPRELFEIKEIRDWVLSLFEMSNCWPYLIITDLKISGFMKLLVLCQLNPSEIIRNDTTQKFKVPFDPQKLMDFVKILFNKLNEYCDEHGLSEETNKEISNNILHYYTDGAFPIDGHNN